MDDKIYVTELIPHTSGKIRKVLDARANVLSASVRILIPEYPGSFGISTSQWNKLQSSEHVLAAISGGNRGGMLLYVVGTTPWEKKNAQAFHRLMQTVSI